MKHAKDLYVLKELKHQPFKFDHAWAILKYQEKWAEPLAESSHANDLDSPLEGNTLNSQDSDEVVGVCRIGLGSGSEGRPTGRNVVKTRRRIANDKDLMWQEMMNNAAKSQAMMEKQHADNLAITQSKEARAIMLVDLEQRKLEHKQKKLAQRQLEIEIEIMNKDLSTLTPFSKEFWTRKKRAIISNADMPRAVRNLDFSAEGSGGSNEDVYVPQPTNSGEYSGVNYYGGNEVIFDLNNDSQGWTQAVTPNVRMLM